MADFYDIHRDAITRAFVLGTKYPGDSFRVMMTEPLGPPAIGTAPRESSATLITFRRLPNDKCEPFGMADVNAIARWNARHRDTPDAAWGLPDFAGKDAAT